MLTEEEKARNHTIIKKSHLYPDVYGVLEKISFIMHEKSPLSPREKNWQYAENRLEIWAQNKFNGVSLPEGLTSLIKSNAEFYDHWPKWKKDPSPWISGVLTIAEDVISEEY